MGVNAAKCVDNAAKTRKLDECMGLISRKFAKIPEHLRRVWRTSSAFH